VELEQKASRARYTVERAFGQLLEQRTPGIERAGRGKGSSTDPLPSLADMGVDKHLAHSLRRLAEIPGDVFDAALDERDRQINARGRREPVQAIARRMTATSEREAIQAAAVASMPVLVSDRYQLIHDDMETTTAIEPESVDHIICDPPYPREFLPCFGHLARRAQEWLKPGGSLVVMSGQSYLPEVLAALSSSGLTYRWTFAYLTPGQSPQLLHRHVNSNWKPVFWFTKGNVAKELPWSSDTILSTANDKRFHHWGQSESGMIGIVELTSLQGQIVLDPFCGGGATGVAAIGLGRRFVGMDIDETCIDKTAARLMKMGSSGNRVGGFGGS
jgi:16S rRNA G966 N2-methylase RsmD